MNYTKKSNKLMFIFISNPLKVQKIIKKKQKNHNKISKNNNKEVIQFNNNLKLLLIAKIMPKITSYKMKHSFK